MLSVQQQRSPLPAGVELCVRIHVYMLITLRTLFVALANVVAAQRRLACRMIDLPLTVPDQ